MTAHNGSPARGSQCLSRVSPVNSIMSCHESWHYQQCYRACTQQASNTRGGGGRKGEAEPNNEGTRGEQGKRRAETGKWSQSAVEVWYFLLLFVGVLAWCMCCFLWCVVCVVVCVSGCAPCSACESRALTAANHSMNDTKTKQAAPTQHRASHGTQKHHTSQ